MVASKTLRSQLSRLKLHFWIFGRAEVKELRKILKPGEIIVHCAHGYYHGGSGLLVATNERLLLIDKRPFFLNLEDMKYQNIKGVACNCQLLTATITINCGIKKLQFRSVSDARLKMIADYVNEEMDFAKRQFAKALTETRINLNEPKAYQNPAWSPHHPVAVSYNRRPRKFYPASKLVTHN